MNLYLKQRGFSIKQKYNVLDENGDCVYKISGKTISLGKQIRIYDMKGAELIYIKQSLTAPINMPTFNLIIEGKTITTVVKDCNSSNRFTFKDLDWEMLGDNLGRNYQVLLNQNVLMSASTKKWFIKTHNLVINDEANLILCLACAVIMDCVYHEGELKCCGLRLRG